MVYNILNGDALAHNFSATKITGEIIIVREGFIDGDLSGNKLRDFWKSRAQYMGITDSEYQNSVVKEFEKIMNAADNSVFNLWFEYDLFCQVNMWFVISLIARLAIKKKVFAIYSSYLDKMDKRFWNGFGAANSDELKICFANKISLDENDLRLGNNLWEAYKDGDIEALMRLSKNQTLAFPYLQAVVKAHIDRYPANGAKGRPQQVVEDIIKNISTDFHKVFHEFAGRESIYGFGDIQLKHLYDKVIDAR